LVSVHHVELIAPGLGLADLEHPVIELDVRADFGPQAVDQLLIAVLDRIQADIALDIHHEVLQCIQAIGIVALSGEIGPRHHLQETFCRGIIDFLVEQRFAADVGPGVLVVVRADAFVILDRRDQIGAALAKRLDRVGGLGAVFAAHPRHVVQQLAVELDLFGVHRNGLQAEMLDQLAQRIGAGHRVVIDLGDAGFVHCRRRIELACHDLAADPVGRLVDGDAAKLAELLFEIPGAHQAPRPAADDCKIQHVVFRRPSRPPAFAKHPV
jgi:hypothetical protein